MTGCLTIERLRIGGVIPAGHENPARILAALAQVTAARLARQSAIRLSGFGEDDPRVIVIDRLEIAMADARIDDVDRLLGQLADGIAAATARIAHEPAGNRLLIFASAGSRLAAFLRAMLRGEGAERWWFGDFADLQILPRSAALRTALLRDANVGRDALAGLAEIDRARLCEALTEIDAGLVLDAVARTLPEGESEELWHEALALLDSGGAAGQVAAELHGLAALLAEFGPALPRAAPAVIRLCKLLRRRASPALAEAIGARAGRRLAQLLPEASPSDLSRLLALPRETCDLAARHCETAARQAEDAAVAGFTRHGGMLLLWPHLPEFEAGLLRGGPGDPIGILSLLALASVFEPRDAMAAIGDTVLRAAFGVGQRASDDALVRWLGTVPPTAIIPARSGTGDLLGLPPPFGVARRQHRALRAAGHHALAHFARRLPGFAGSSPAFLRANLLSLGARVTTGPETVHAVFERPPLDVLLSISGLADRTVALPGGRLLTLERER